MASPIIAGQPQTALPARMVDGVRRRSAHRSTVPAVSADECQPIASARTAAGHDPREGVDRCCDRRRAAHAREDEQRRERDRFARQHGGEGERRQQAEQDEGVAPSATRPRSTDAAERRASPQRARTTPISDAWCMARDAATMLTSVPVSTIVAARPGGRAQATGSRARASDRHADGSVAVLDAGSRDVDASTARCRRVSEVSSQRSAPRTCRQLVREQHADDGADHDRDLDDDGVDRQCGRCACSSGDGVHQRLAHDRERGMTNNPPAAASTTRGQ